MRFVRITLVNNSDHLVVARLQLHPLDLDNKSLKDQQLEVAANKHSTAVFCPSPDTLRPPGHRRPGRRKDVVPKIRTVTRIAADSRVMVHNAGRPLTLMKDLGGKRGDDIEEVLVHVARYATRGSIIASIRDAKGVLRLQEEELR